MSLLEGELTSAAMCWVLERGDGAGIALTSHDRALDRNGVRHLPAPAMTPGSVTRSLGTEPHSGEVAGAVTCEALDEQELAIGRWDGARVRLSICDWVDEGAQPIELLAGEVGSVAIDGDAFTADLRGAAARLEAPVCPATSAECRAEFGGKQCRVDLAGRSKAAMVNAVNGAEITLDVPVDERLALGRLRYMSGASCGLSTVILAAGGNVVRVRDLPRAAIAVGDRVEVREGCDKRLKTCSARFANAANFRGEPHLPGTDLLTRYPGV